MEFNEGRKRRFKYTVAIHTGKRTTVAGTCVATSPAHARHIIRTRLEEMDLPGEVGEAVRSK